MKIYLANGLFTAGDRMFNERIYDRIQEELPEAEIYAPQFNLAINDKTKSASSLPIYDGDTEKLKWANVMIAVLDGQDLGVATEIGWFAGHNDSVEKEKKIILGLYTDNRDASATMSEEKNKDMVEKGVGESQYSYINLYTIGAVKKHGVLFNDLDELIEYLKNLNI